MFNIYSHIIFILFIFFIFYPIIFLSCCLEQCRHDGLYGIEIIGLILALGLILRRNRKLSLEKAGADIVIEEALEEKPLDQELTDREMEIVPLLAAGLTSQQIADKVCLSLATIKWYRKRLLEKFQASNSAELVSILKEKGLL